LRSWRFCAKLFFSPAKIIIKANGKVLVASRWICGANFSLRSAAPIEATAALREVLEMMSDEREDAPKRRMRFDWFSRRNLLIAAAIPLALILALALAAVLLVRLGYAGRYIEANFVAQMDKFGVRTEIGSFRQNFAPLGTTLRDAKFYDKETGELLAKADLIQLDATVTDLFAPSWTRTVRLDSTEIAGLEAWVKFDEAGRSNFSRLKIPEQEESNLRFDFNTMKFLLRDSTIHYGDATRKLSGEARNVRLFVEPEAGLSKSEAEIENRRFRFELSANGSRLTIDGANLAAIQKRPFDAEIAPFDFVVNGVATESYAEINELKLKTPLAETILNGRLENWERLKYKLNIVSSTIDLQKTQEILHTAQALRGFANASGTVEGEGENYQIKLDADSDALAAENVRLQGLKVSAAVVGQDDSYQANGKAIADLLNARDFELNFLQIAGKVMGTGTDFRFLGDLQAAAARVPGGRIANLILRDAVAEYEDAKLNANLGSIFAASFEGFDAKARNLRAANAKIQNANGATKAATTNLRADSIAAQGAEASGVSVANFALENAASITKISAADTQAAKVKAQGATLQQVRVGNVQAVVRGAKAASGTIGNLAAESLVAQGANVRNLRAQNAAFQTADGVTNIDLKQTNIGGLSTDAIVLGSVNIAGVRLKIVRSRIEGSTADINAGDVAINKNKNLPDGGKLENVRLSRPVFVVEPSGRYRASADLSLGGGILGSVNIGAARAAVTATNGQVDLQNLQAQVLDGQLNGAATIVYQGRGESQIKGDFAALDVAKLLALAGGQAVPLDGKTSGTANLTFAGLDFKTASGTLDADITANAGNDQNNRVPLNGKINLRATNGLFAVKTADFKTANSELRASGQFDLRGQDSNLQVALDSTDARELQNLLAVLNVAPDLDKQLAANRVVVNGNFNFAGTINGNLDNPTINGRANLASVAANNQDLGSLSTDLFVENKTIRLANGKLEQTDGGSVQFDLTIPNGDTNKVALKATLNRIEIGGVLSALPTENLPEFLKNANGKTSGKINLTGVPSNLNGAAEFFLNGGALAGAQFDNLTARINFQNSNVLIEQLDAVIGGGSVAVRGNYDNQNRAFNLAARGENLAIEKLRGLLGANAPNLTGKIDFNATGEGRLAYRQNNEIDFSGVKINFSGAGTKVSVDNNAIGEIAFAGKTENQQLNANLTANLNGQTQTIAANLNLADETLPFRAETIFDNTELAPYIAIVRPPKSDETALGGRVTGRATFGGSLRTRNERGELVFSTKNLRGEANLSGLTVRVADVVLSTAAPTRIEFSPASVTIDNARFVGAGSDLRVNGTAFFAGDESNNLTADGIINLRVLNFLSNNQFFGGLANLSVRLAGTGDKPRLNGAATLDNATFTAIISNERTTFTNIKGRVLFNTNQAQIERLEGRLGGGSITASGGVLLDDKLNINSYRLDVRGDDVSARLPQDFRTTGDANIQINGRRDPITGQFNSIISGTIYATRGEYSKDFDIADLLTTRRSASISAGTGEPALGVPQLDLRVVSNRDALVVRNNIADLTGSVDVRVTGDVDEPVLTGRITATGGTIRLLNNQRYDITRATIDFPAQIDAAPVINFQGEATISGYQVFLSAAGDLSDTQNFALNVRTNPALPQADAVSLVTTGALSGSEGGIGTVAQTGINTAADLVTDALVNAPIRKATDRLFGLNRFELNPVLAGQRGINPSARLTVGRQINRNLSVTYSTNLSEDRNQVVALEYRVSNRVSLIAQYEQQPLSNVTKRRDDFSFAVRFRRRF
jgi:translocation and assembly module TamB